MENLPISFVKGVEEAWFSYNQDGVAQVEIVDGDTIVTPGWMKWQSNVILHIRFSDGTTFSYDGKTGQVITPASGKAQLLVAGVESITSMELDSSMILNWTTSPEYGYNPNMEITPLASGQASCNVLSNWGYRPIAIWVTSMWNLGYGGRWERVEVDQYGSFPLWVTAGVPLLVWAEYSPQVNALSASEKGG
jgi:hypothetical protein